MGDRCYMSIEFRAKDKKKVMKAFGLEDEWVTWDNPDNKKVLAFSVDEINYAGETQRQELAEAGVPFMGMHGSGCAYGHGLFAACGGEHAYCETLADSDGHPAIRTYYEDGQIKMYADDVRVAQEYYAMLERANLAIYGKPKKGKKK